MGRTGGAVLAGAVVLGLAATAFLFTVPLRAESSPIVPRRVILELASEESLVAYLYEPPSTGASPGRDEAPSAVIFYSGEAGWGPLPQETASHLASEGRPVLGIASPDYFKKRIEAPGLIADLRSFRAFVNKSARRPEDAPVILAGFAFGAEMIPYILTRAGVNGVRGLLLIAPDTKGAKVYSAAVRIGMQVPADEAFDVAEEIRRLPPLPVVLMQGTLDLEGESQSLLPLFRGPKAFLSIPEGDHFLRKVRGPYLGQVSSALRFIEKPGKAPRNQDAPPPEPAPGPEAAPGPEPTPPRP